MDIKQLKKFISIVKSGNNLSLTSKKIHITQPALSKMIKTIEDEESVLLFNRNKGKLSSLTPVGEIFFEKATKVVEEYEKMIDYLDNANHKITGEIKIGIPPLILSTVFGEFLPQFILNNTEVKVTVIEAGAYELKKALLLNEIDLAVLLDPIDLINIDRTLLLSDELLFFMDKKNPLAKKNILDWNDIAKQPLAIFESSFMIHHIVKDAYESHNLRPKIRITSQSWDYLLQTTKNSNLVTILPGATNQFINDDIFTYKRLTEPMIWNVILVRQKKKNYRFVENYCYDAITTYFNKLRKV